MIDAQIQDALQQFVGDLRETDAMQEFINAQTDYANNPDLKSLRDSYTEMVQDFHRKQSDGTHSQQDIDDIRAIQMELQDHPVTQKVYMSQENLQGLLRGCNQRISTRLGLDFAQIAGSAGGCGGGSCGGGDCSSGDCSSGSCC